MYKLETWVLKYVVKVLDALNKPVPSSTTSKYIKKRVKNYKKAAKLSQLIKDNYTDVTP